jgi:hypothetical protein
MVLIRRAMIMPILALNSSEIDKILADLMASANFVADSAKNFAYFLSFAFISGD